MHEEEDDAGESAADHLDEVGTGAVGNEVGDRTGERGFSVFDIELGEGEGTHRPKKDPALKIASMYTTIDVSIPCVLAYNSM